MGQIFLRFGYQGSEFLAKKWDQWWKNIPRYDPGMSDTIVSYKAHIFSLVDCPVYFYSFLNRSTEYCFCLE